MASVTLIVCLLVLVLHIFPNRSMASTSAAHEDQSPGKFVVKLHRQRVPIRTESDSLSYKNVYFGTVYIGAPEQEFSVVFDTGSGHVIVPSTACRSKTCRIHRRYNRTGSPHAADIEYDGTPVLPGQPRDQITVAFGTGQVTGQFVSESLCLSRSAASLVRDEATEAATAVAAPNKEAAQPQRLEEDCTNPLRVVMATEMTHDPFHSFSFDGVLGLGLDSLALAPEFSFVGQLIAQGRLSKPIFGVFIADNDEDQSEICLGGYAPERMQSEPAWAPVAMPDLGHWQVQIQSVRVGNVSLDFCNDGQCRAVVDTGASLLAVPQDLVDDLDAELSEALRDPPSGSTGQDVDCKHAHGAPLHFVIDGLTITLSAGDYMRPTGALQSEGDAATHANAKSGEHITRCRPALMPIDFPAPLGPKLFIWGEPVLRKYYTLFDFAEKRIGFGLAAHENKVLHETTSRNSLRRPLLVL